VRLGCRRSSRQEQERRKRESGQTVGDALFIARLVTGTGIATTTGSQRELSAGAVRGIDKRTVARPSDTVPTNLATVTSCDLIMNAWLYVRLRLCCDDCGWWESSWVGTWRAPGCVASIGVYPSGHGPPLRPITVHPLHFNHCQSSRSIEVLFICPRKLLQLLVYFLGSRSSCQSF
jgi:hypothetical protein